MRRRKAAAGDPKRAVAYLRVSTDRQEHGPEAQRAVLTSWAEREGVQIVEWLQEDDVSGATEAADRPELQRAFAAVSTHGAGILVAAKRDRIAREMVVARDIGTQVRKLGAVVVTADGMSNVEDRSDGRLREGISDLFAEHERQLIAERTTAALAVMRAKGMRTGTAPYGYQAAPAGAPSKKSGRPLPLVPHVAEQAVCTLVVRMHEAGSSERQIEDELKRLGVKSRNGHRLNQTQVHRIIKNCEVLRRWFPGHAQSSEMLEPADVNTTSLRFACAAGHVYEDRFVGKYCVQGACANGVRQDPARRIEER